ncbi:MAG: hypothetical protein LUI87_01245 [Lachnospiraceae bacterium]|nr:hypothetical protein [Lachnospiraceae bacterium]
MESKTTLRLLGLSAVFVLTCHICMSGENAQTAVLTVRAEEDESDGGDSLASITPSDYLVENAADYITVGSLKGLSASQYTYEITDEMVQEAIEEELSESTIETVVDRAAAMGDVVNLDLACTVESTGETDSINTYFCLGDADYGEEFDEALVGVSATEVVTFSITFTERDLEDTMIEEEWAGEAVTFMAFIGSVCEVSEPEYTDDYVLDYTDYSTKEEYEASVREDLAAEYEEYSYSDVMEELMDAALDASEIMEIPEELYELCYEETVSDYMNYLGTDDLDEIFEDEEYDITWEDLENEAMEMAERRLLISYICETNHLSVTEDDYISFVTESAELYAYDSLLEFETDMIRSYLVWYLYESEACEVLYENADITMEVFAGEY